MTQVSPFGREFTYKSPRFTFPGDEAVGQESYSQCLDNWYVSILPDLEAGAAAHGVTITPESLERAKRMLTGQFWLDSLIDSSPNDNATNIMFERIVRSLPEGSTDTQPPYSSKPELSTAVALLRNSTRTLPLRIQERIVEGGMQIRELTAQQITASSIGTYIKKRRREGKISGELVAASLSSTESEVSEDYKLWLEDVVACLSLLDHASDLREDYAQGLTLVTPTRLHQADLAVAGISSLSQTLATRNGRKATRRAFGQPIHAARAYFQSRPDM